MWVAVVVKRGCWHFGLGTNHCTRAGPHLRLGRQPATLGVGLGKLPRPGLAAVSRGSQQRPSAARTSGRPQPRSPQRRTAGLVRRAAGLGLRRASRLVLAAPPCYTREKQRIKGAEGKPESPPSDLA